MIVLSIDVISRIQGLGNLEGYLFWDLVAAKFENQQDINE
jgi:hypothetical protein